MCFNQRPGVWQLDFFFGTNDTSNNARIVCVVMKYQHGVEDLSFGMELERKQSNYMDTP
jgi:hypothetical protein